MKLESIRVAQNGFVLEDGYGNLHVAKTLLELAQIAGEAAGPNSGFTNYTPGYGLNDLTQVRSLALDNQKINAIKILRDTFTPRLGLKEAKELMEVLCGV